MKLCDLNLVIISWVGWVVSMKLAKICRRRDWTSTEESIMKINCVAVVVVVVVGDDISDIGGHCGDGGGGGGGGGGIRVITQNWRFNIWSSGIRHPSMVLIVLMLLKESSSDRHRMCSDKCVSDKATIDFRSVFHGELNVEEGKRNVLWWCGWETFGVNTWEEKHVQVSSERRLTGRAQRVGYGNFRYRTWSMMHQDAHILVASIVKDGTHDVLASRNNHDYGFRIFRVIIISEW